LLERLDPAKDGDHKRGQQNDDAKKRNWWDVAFAWDE